MTNLFIFYISLIHLSFHAIQFIFYLILSIIIIQTVNKLTIKSNIFFLFLYSCIVGSTFRFRRWRANRPIGSPRPNNKFLLIKFPPISNPFFPTSFPLLFRQYPILFHHSLGLKLFNISLIFRLLHFYQMIFFIIKFFKNISTYLLVKFGKCRLIQQQLPIFLPFLILLLTLECGPIPCLPHDPQIYILFLPI